MKRFFKLIFPLGLVVLATEPLKTFAFAPPHKPTQEAQPMTIQNKTKSFMGADQRPLNLPKTENELKAYRHQRVELLKLPSSLRTVMKSPSKPYRQDIGDALAVRTNQVPPNQKPLPVDFSYRELQEDEVIQCETIFFDKLWDELQGFINIGWSIPGPKNFIVRQESFDSWLIIGDSMPQYLRQAVGYSYRGHDYIFMKFRKLQSKDLKAPLPDNSAEYQVKDGGHNYFQFHCDMKKKEAFHPYVHGEA